MKDLEEVSNLKEGRYIMLDGEPCKIKKMDVSAPGKHGHAKARIQGVSIFDGSSHNTIKPTDERVEVPIVKKRSAQVLSASGGTVQLMDSKSYETFEKSLPESFDVTEGDKITYWEVLDKKLLVRED